MKYDEKSPYFCRANTYSSLDMNIDFVGQAVCLGEAAYYKPFSPKPIKPQ